MRKILASDTLPIRSLELVDDCNDQAEVQICGPNVPPKYTDADANDTGIIQVSLAEPLSEFSLRLEDVLDLIVHASICVPATSPESK